MMHDELMFLSLLMPLWHVTYSFDMTYLLEKCDIYEMVGVVSCYKVPPPLLRQGMLRKMTLIAVMRDVLT